ncbi:hypothetical protein CRUP_017889, partial [Coryphaenoides rupestris]
MKVSVRSLTDPVGLLRLAALVLSCLAFGLVASVGAGAGTPASSYWAWCMFTWCFCCFFTLLILILEFTELSGKVPMSWEDFTTAFAMLATLMCLAASVIYPVFFTCSGVAACPRPICATVASWLCFLAYGGEVVVTRLRPRGQISGFLSTVSGLLKILETFVACIIFTSLDSAMLSGFPGLQWCVSVYCLCFICALLIILLTIGRLLSYFPVSFERLVTVTNVLSATMYLTAMVIWPVYGFRGVRRPSPTWDKVLVVTFMSIFNFVVYTVDSIFSIRMVFWSQAS